MRVYLTPLTTCLLLLAGCTPKDYTATATIQVLRNDPGSIAATEKSVISEQERIEFETSLLESNQIIVQVEKALRTSDQMDAFAKPYFRQGEQLEVPLILEEHRTIKTNEGSLMIQISYAHPTPEIAAYIANLFAKTYISYHETLLINASMGEPQEWSIRVDQQQKRVESLRLKLTKEREEKGIDGEINKELLRDLEIQQTFLEKLKSQLEKETTQQTSRRRTVRVIDEAVVPSSR